MAADHGNRAMFVAGGTDLFPKLKRRQFDVDALIGLDFLRREVHSASHETVVDAGVTLAGAAANDHLNDAFRGYAQAAGFCLKKDGDICLVAPSSPRCWAVSSSDTAPMAIALGGLVTLQGPDGERELPVAALYQDDGIDYLAKKPHEVVTALRLPVTVGTRSAYVKLRRRGSIDFPIAGAAVAIELDGDVVTGCRIVLSAVASHPLESPAAEEFLTGKRLDTDTLREAAEIAAKPAKPLDNADLSHFWRKRMVRVVVEQALEEATINRGVSRVKLLGQ
jgi:4-hydroxybenzoyl-CoA reductase subunit beta